MATSKYDLKNAPESFTEIYKGPLRITKYDGNTLNKLRDESQNTALLVAAGQGSLEAIKYLLDLGASIHDKNFFGKSVLHFASAMRHEAAVRLFLERGANVKATDTSGNTVLHSTAEGGSAEIASMFLDLGIDIQGKNFANETALHTAAKSDNLEVADFLIKRGADVNKRSNPWNKYNPCGMTPLLNASEKGSEDLVELLLKHGAEVQAKDSQDSNVLHYAAECGNERLIKLFLNLKIDINEKGFKGRTALHGAAQNGNSRAVGVLLDHGAFINAQDCDGRSALNYACTAGNERIKQLMLNRGALITEDILYCAVKFNNVEFIKQILHSGIDINSMDKEGQTPLHYACAMGNENVVRLLLARGASITKDNSNKTVLHFGAQGGNENIIKLFLNSGIAVDATDKYGNTALHLATERKNLNAVKLLLDSGANVSNERALCEYKGNESALTIAIQCDFENGVKLLLERGANIIFHKHGSGALPKIKNENIIKLLLNFGLDSNYIDDDVLTAAFWGNRYLIAEKLFENGEKLGSSLDFIKSCYYMKQYVDESLQIFLDYGLNVNALSYSEKSIVRDSLIVENYSAAKILTMHVVKMKNQNLYVADFVWNDIMNNEQLKTYQKKCDKEIKKMKREEFYNLAVSCFDVLTTKNPQKLVTYARNKNIIEDLESYDKKNLFPIYFNLLYKQIQRGTWRKLLIEQAGDFFIAVTSPKCTDHQLPKLPPTFIHELSSYLTNKELKMLARACKSKFDMDIHNVTKNMIFN